MHFTESRGYGKLQKGDSIDEIADSLWQMQKEAFTIKEECLSQFKQIGKGTYIYN